MGDTMLGDPHRQHDDHRKTTQKQFCAVDHTILMPTPWLMGWNMLDQSIDSLSSFSSGCRGRNFGLWWFTAFGAWDISVQLWMRGRSSSFFIGTYNFKQWHSQDIQFKDGTLGSFGENSEAFALRSRPSKNGGPTLTPQQLTGRLRTAETSNRVLFMVTWWQLTPLKWCGLPYVAVKAQRLTGWPFGWWLDLEQGEVKIWMLFM